uniref:Hypothetical retrotransposon n=1 Tax=Ipomoea batatas TaxID=4120 RepID=Q5MG99_IPOBA|nr:hypothetical retrotransposon [Ipomoea batatas]
METNTSNMVRLNGRNYHIWKAKMKDLLFVKKLHLPVFASAKPENMSDEEWDFEHQQVCGYIRQWVEDNVLNHIINETHARSLWNKLETLYASKTGNNKLFLLKQMMNIRYREGTLINDHVNDFQGVLDQLSGMGIKFEDEVLGLWLLNTLPDSWETFRVSLTNSAPNGVVTMEYVKSGILNEEARRRSQDTSTSQSDILVTDDRGRNKQKGQRGRDKSRSKSRSRYKDIECHYCGKKSHIKKYSFKWKREKKQDNKDGDTGNQVATVRADLLVACDDNVINVACHETTWIVDSGAAYHVTPRKEFFTSYTPGDFGELRMGNDGQVKVTGTGTVCLETSNGTKLVLKNVKHAPDIRLNLISTGKLDDDGFCCFFGDGHWKITKGSLVVARGNKSSNLYSLQSSVSDDSVNVVEKECASELWHKRLGHMSVKGIDYLAKKSKLSGVKEAKLDKCVHCLAGKQRRVSFMSHPPTRKSEPLDLIHSDVCGPMKVRSLGGASYFVTFIDDYSRKLWVYTLKHKSDVLGVFKEFHALVERQTGKKLKCIRTDNGGEYCGPFDEYCRRYGIRHQKTPPKIPQLNGLAERMNRTIMERVRCMLDDAKLPSSFWAEAVSTAVHVINLSPVIALKNEVPDKVWCGKDVSYDHLRVFGCKAFVHVPRDERSKLDSKTRQCIFIGYGFDEFGYRLYDPVEKKLVRSRDVVFFENQTIEDIDKVKQPESRDSGSLVDIEPVSRRYTDDVDEVQENVQNGDPVPDYQGDTVDVDGHADDVVHQEQEVPSQVPVDLPRRSDRERRPSTRYSPSQYVLLTDGGEPESYEEAMESDQKRQWFEAMQEEMNSLYVNDTFELVKAPKNRKALKNRWVYRVKHEEGTSVPRFKARLVVKGFSQKKGIDFDEIFSPVVKFSSIRVVLGLAARLDIEIEQMDVKTAFLHGDLDEEIYMEQPEGFKVKGKEDYVCRLKKSLYGLKQAPRQWYKKFTSVMSKHGYKKTSSDHCVFVNRYSDDDFVILLLYVDDMLIVGRNASRIQELKQELSKSFSMKDMGPAKQILGMKIIRDRQNKKLWLSQEKYIEKVLERFHMNEAKPVSTPLDMHFKLCKKQCPSSEKEKEEMQRVPYSSAVGSLMYAMVCTRPDIAHAVGVVSRFLSNPGREHWDAVKWILRYLRGTSSLSLCFGTGKPILTGYTDSDMAGDIDTRKSTSGYLITYAGGAVSWQSRLQKCVDLSTTEAEFIASVEASKEMLWMKKFLQELGFVQDRSKHIDTRYHWIRDILECKMLELEKIHTDDNGSDMMTKALPRGKFEEAMGECCNGFLRTVILEMEEVVEDDLSKANTAVVLSRKPSEFMATEKATKQCKNLYLNSSPILCIQERVVLQFFRGFWACICASGSAEASKGPSPALCSSGECWAEARRAKSNTQPHKNARS